MTEYIPPAIRAYEFERYVAKTLQSILNATDIEQDRKLPGGARPDFIVKLPSGETAIIETKLITPSTEHRVRSAVQQLTEYGRRYEQAEGRTPRLYLAIPGVLSDRYRELLAHEEIDLIDGPIIRNASDPGDLLSFLAESQEDQSKAVTTTVENLLNGLRNIPPGKDAWSQYQSHVRDILAFLLCPPLQLPLIESANISGVNRRDIIFPNYATDSFWTYLRSFYEAHYIVVDAKNYTGKVPKSGILQLANYLSPHGAGLFGAIVSRNGCGRAADVTRREQWLLHRKMIITLDDEDMRQMIKLHAADSDPTEVIRQKIEDFRLGF